MLAFFQWLGGLIAGPVIAGLITAYKAKLEARGKTDALAVDLAAKEIAAEIECRKAAKEIVIAEQGRWYTALPRPLFALAFIIFIWKVVVWDKVLKLGSTDPLSPEFMNLMTIIVTAYFGGRTIEKVARIFRR